MSNRIYYTRDRDLLLITYFLFYYAVLLGFSFDDRLLSQYHPIFFNYTRDLTELALIAGGLPGWMIAHPIFFTVADILAFLVPLPLIRQQVRKTNFSPWPGIAFICYLSLYLLLADIFWQVHYEPFILFVLLAFVWTTSQTDRFYLILKGCRFYFLYLFVSAAIWKLTRGAIFNSQEMSNILLYHHTDLLTGDCTGVSCRLYRWLIANPAVSQSLYIAAFLLEALFVTGFFTRRRDRLLIVLAILFVVADWVLMRIPYWTILLGILPLWIRDRSAPPSKKKKIVLYETTHHENLPALLDMAESHFGQVAVFLKEVSYHNLCGKGSPEQRWPQTDFFVQTADCPNRRFIRQLFRFIRRHGYTHLHLCTLDNNLLIFALRIYAIGPVHLSLTVHEINEYFFHSWRTLRDSSETLAKNFLRRRIRHYHFFLPAMADQFRQRLPGSTTVFIPSRFYSGHQTPTTPPSIPPAQPSTTSPSIPHTQPFKIVIPGSLDPNRRNYNDVIQTIALFQPPPTHSPIQLILLGDSSTETSTRIIDEFQRITTPHVAIRSFKGYIPETTYEQELAGAHLIWSPLNIHKKSSRNNPETYGLTTASGLTSDLLLNNIPALVPIGLDVPEPFRPAICPYRSPEEALEIIHRFMEGPTAYTAHRDQIDRAFSLLTKENFIHAFAELTLA